MPVGLDQETLDMILESLRGYARRELPDARLLALDARDEFPADVLSAMCGPELGIHLLFVPEAFEGMGGGAFDVYRLCEELARIDLGIATGLLATSLGSDPIAVGGTLEQKKYWLGRIATEGMLMAYGATEPQAGSDLAALRTTAEPIERDGAVVAYRLSGSKQWISNGGVAGACTILALAPGGPSWFVVERGAEGFGHGKHEDKHGIRASNTAALTLDGVVVDADRLIGGVEGRGLEQAQAVFGYTRLMVAAFGLGAGWAALDRAIPYSTERIQAGGPLSEKQGYTHKLIVPHAVRLEASRAYIEETAERLDAGEAGLATEGAIAKYFASEAGNRAADASLQALGGYGYTREYMVEKIKRDVRITTIYEGTSEILEMTISRDRWQLHLKTRGQHYVDAARGLEALHASHPEAGCDAVALALRALAVLLERAREARLTRNQHVLFRVGEWIANAECAAALARHAVRAAEGRLPSKNPKRFDAATVATISRTFAREAALIVGEEGLRWICGAGGVSDAALPAFEQALGLSAIHRAQAGLVTDMDRIADALYGRSGSHAATG
jgi:alkylation response protein AidB-like acyl-CoA dehydrogenase